MTKMRRGRPPAIDKFEDVDAWLIVRANEIFRAGQVQSACAAISRVVEEAWTFWDNGTPGGRSLARVLVGNKILQATDGKDLRRNLVLGQSRNAIEKRVLSRLQPRWRSLQRTSKRDGTKKLRFRIEPSIYHSLLIAKALNTNNKNRLIYMRRQ